MHSRTPEPILQPGAIVGTDYVVESFLAGGGMGQVFVARDLRLDRRVAVKVLRADVAASPEADARFQREARALSRVVHPNVVGVHAFGRIDAGWYLVMEYVEGEALDTLLRRHGPLPVAEALAVARQVAAGLGEAHALGIVHRDIKPGNVLLRQLASGGVLAKVVDFGLARDLEPEPAELVTRDAGLVGTPAYMSPEQIQGQALDGRSDLYSLAIVVFQMLTGRLPFFRDTVQGLLLAHLVDEPAPLTLPGAEDRWPAGLERALLRGLARKSADRPATIREFADALDRSVLPVATGLASAAAATCPGCGHGTDAGGGFCSRCGSAVPLSACVTCGAVREGERYACVECGSPLLQAARRARAGEAEAGAGLSLATCAVLVAVAEGLGLDAAAQADFADTFLAVVEREGGRVMALLGHEAIAGFGLGGMRERELEGAIDAALRVQAAFAATDAGRSGRVALRVGVELGLLHTRGVGVAWGTVFASGEALEAARTVARSVPAGGVGLGEAAQRDVRGLYETTPCGDHCRLVERRREIARTLADYTTRGSGVRLVGRDGEMASLLRAARRARRESRLVAVPVLGAAGSGKSRLVGELLQRLEESGETWQVDLGRCSAVGLPVAYEPFAEMLRARVKADEASGDADIVQRLGRLPGLDGQGTDTELAGRRVRALARTLGLVEGGTATTRPATEAEQQAAFEAWLCYVRGACARQPLILVVEHLQWAKRPTFDLLRHIARNAEDLPLLLVLLVRSELADTTLEAVALPVARTAAVDVPPLEPEDVAELVDALRPGARLPAGLVHDLHAFTDGLPARLEETVDALTDDGVFERTARGWRVPPERAAQVTLGRSLAELVLRRVKRLPPAERLVLEAVSVAGDSAPRGLIAAMIEREPSEREIDAAKAGGLLVELRAPQFRGQRELAFRQSQVADIVAGSLPRAQVAEYHRRAARWLLAWQDARPPGFGARLAHHFMVAGDEAEATRYLLQAAEDALRALANRDAFDAYGAAVAVARDWLARLPELAAARATLVQALVGRAEVGVRVGEMAEALAAAAEAVELVRDLGEAAWQMQVRALAVHGDALRSSGQNAEALPVLQAAADLAMSRPDGAGLAAQATGLLAGVLLASGRDAEVEALVAASQRRWGALDGEPELHLGLGRLHTWLGHVLLRRKQFEAARIEYTAARARFARVGDDVSVAMTDLALGNVAYHSGDLVRAGDIYRECARICRSTDYLLGCAMASTNVGNVLLDQKRYDEALAALRDGERTARRIGALYTLAETLRLVGHVLLAKGDLFGARGAASEAYAIAEQMGNRAMAEASRTVLNDADSMGALVDAATAAELSTEDIPTRA